MTKSYSQRSQGNEVNERKVGNGRKHKKKKKCLQRTLRESERKKGD